MTALLLAVLVLAVLFDYINGFHDTANAIATSVATRALRPAYAIGMAAAFNFIGAFAGTAVAKTIGGGLVDEQTTTQTVVAAALIGAIIWNLITWRLGIPSSSSHALIGGLLGATIVAAGVGAIKMDGLVNKVLIPLFSSPLIGFLGAFLLMIALFSAGVIPTVDVPTWVIVVSATAISLGTAAGGWRIMATMGHRVVELEPIHGFAAETTAATVLYTTAHFGMPVSTTHVISSSIMGVGTSKGRHGVRWGVARSILVAWIVTIPAAATMGALSWVVLDALGIH